ncbi:hypothetical protein NC652_041227 [Populus alba x Populus x berolinensis]|uniref:Uncharacterized protein n=1 Tax=Populus alba x Populus x berolinensis TaxID=444605 RepID=A0AAD6L9D7_9ROSI|nr:hypothetical protein NC652_041227 [Populus alba x Populus x berolinensis]KAJ6952273.1 hypothetical protein NC653_041426 [Populus alba x Populus x berolinensis]
MLQVASLSESNQLQQAKFLSDREILRFIAGRTEHERTSHVTQDSMPTL